MEQFKEYTQKEIAELMKGAPKSGSVEVRFKDPKRTGTITLRDYWIEYPGGAREHRPFIDAKGNERVVKYTKKKTLNMSRENDRLEYAHLLEHPKYVNGATPLLHLYNYDEEATNYVEMKDAAAKADAIISKLKGDKLQDLARVMAIRVRPGSSDIVLKRALYEFSETKDAFKKVGALKVLEEIESPDYENKCLLHKAVAEGLVKVNNGRYVFNQIGMGSTFDVSLQFLKENTDIKSELDKAVNLKQVE